MKNTEDIKSWARDVVNQVKYAFGINSGKSLMRDEVGRFCQVSLPRGFVKTPRRLWRRSRR